VLEERRRTPITLFVFNPRRGYFHYEIRSASDVPAYGNFLTPLAADVHKV